MEVNLPLQSFDINAPTGEKRRTRLAFVPESEHKNGFEIVISVVTREQVPATSVVPFPLGPPLHSSAERMIPPQNSTPVSTGMISGSAPSKSQYSGSISSTSPRMGPTDVDGNNHKLCFASKEQVLLSDSDISQEVKSARSPALKSDDPTSGEGDAFDHLPITATRKHTMEHFTTFLNKNLAKSLRAIQEGGEETTAERSRSVSEDVTGIHEVGSGIDDEVPASEGGSDLAPVFIEAVVSTSRLHSQSAVVEPRESEEAEEEDNPKPTKSRVQRAEDHHNFLHKNYMQSKACLSTKKLESKEKCSSNRGHTPEDGDEGGAPGSEDELASEGGRDMPEVVVEQIIRAASSFRPLKPEEPSKSDLLDQEPIPAGLDNTQPLGISDEVLVYKDHNEGNKAGVGRRPSSAESVAAFLPSVST